MGKSSSLWKSSMEVQSIHGVRCTEYRDDSPVRTVPCLRVEIVLQDMHIHIAVTIHDDRVNRITSRHHLSGSLYCG